MKKPRVIMFGASPSGISFIRKHTADYTFLAFCDNDPKKQGKMLEGLMIISPTELSKFDYDQIIISSFWSASIRDQLTQTLGIPEALIHVPAKKKVAQSQQPFQDPAFRLQALRLIQKISDFYNQQGIQLLIDFGTLLGIARDQDLIPWDTDIDLAIESSQATIAKEAVNALLLELQKGSEGRWTLQCRQEPDGQVSQIKLLYSDGRIHLPIHIQARTEEVQMSRVIASNGFFQAPAKHFSRAEVLTCGAFRFLAPYQYREYLTYVYGPWQKPRPDFSTADYQNTGHCTSLPSSDQVNLS